MGLECGDESVNPDQPEAATPPAETPDGPARVLLHMPVDVRSMALVVITVIAVLAVLHWASPFFIPLMLSLMFSYALTPLVDLLEAKGIRRGISAAVDAVISQNIETRVFGTERGAIPYLNMSFALLEQAVRRTQVPGATADAVPFFNLGGGSRLMLSATASQATLYFLV